MMMINKTRRVVVTGIGLVSPLGVSVDVAMQNLLAGRSGVISLEQFMSNRGMVFPEEFMRSIPSKVVASVPFGDKEGEFNLSKFDTKRNSLFINYALEAADEALKDASITPSTQKELDNIGVSIGSGIGSIEDTYDTSVIVDRYGYRKVSPFFVPRILVNMAAGAVCIKYGFRGPNHCVSTACAAGLNSIGDASRFIQYGDADVMLAGGTEACITPIGLAGFARLRGLSTKFNNEPSKASRPFDADRDGFVIGEGAGILVLEEYEHAKNRGAKIYAELVGYGTSADAHHITTPPPDGSGAVLAMTKAIKQAGISFDEVDYINAHATSTPQGDLAELLAIGTVCKKGVSVSSFKGHLGHLLGAAGAIETVLMLKALKNNLLPPTLNLDNPEKTASNVKLIQKVPLQQRIQYAVKNSFGFGGTNCSLVFRTNF